MSSTQTGANSAPSNTLGNSTKSLHTGRDGSLGKGSGGARRDEIATVKTTAYTLRQEAGRLLWDPLAGKQQKHRVCHCGRSMKGNFVHVMRAPDGSRARLSGLIMCGSAWTCIVCSHRIGEDRRQELELANVAWVKAGGITHLLTLTFPHEFDWLLADLMVDFGKARQAWRNSRAFKSVLGKDGAAGCLGTVASLEVTHGVNGWHPHLHMLAFCRRPLDAAEIDKLTQAWVKALLKNGLGDRSKITDMMAHALDVRGGADAAAYITKYGREEQWGLSSEITGVAKEAKGEHLKPFGLLRASAEGDTRAGALFREFAEAFHGKRLLVWSQGLREWFGLNDIDDEDLANNDEPESEAKQLVGVLTHPQWRIVLSRNAVGDLERYAAECCVDPETGQRDLDMFIECLERAPKKSSGWMWLPMQKRRPF